MGCFASKGSSHHESKKSGSQGGAAQPKPPEKQLLAEGIEDITIDDAMQAKQNTEHRCEEVYEMGKLLGRGGYASVHVGTHKQTGQVFAIKSMRVARRGTVVRGHDTTWKDVAAEVSVMCRIEHPNVVGLKEFFFQGDSVFLVTPLVQGGELLAAVAQRGSYSEADARACFAQLLQGVAYLHEVGIAHRDLKLDNLLLAAKGDISQLRIVDFGLSKGHIGGGLEAFEMATVCGTPHYVAPEIIAVKAVPGSRYSTQVDVWACGVILYVLLSGSPPFFHADLKGLYKQIMHAQYAFQDPVWDAVSDQAKNLISKLLVVDPHKRLTAQEALQHPWMQQSAGAQAASLAGAQANMRELNNRLSLDGEPP